MSDAKRQNLLVGLMLLVLLVAAGWTTRLMLGAKRSAVVAGDNLAECRALAQSIMSLRDKDSVADAGGDAEQREQAIAEQVSAAAAKAGLGGDWLQRIEHKTPRSVGNSPYKRKPSVLYIRGLTLGQLVTLLHELTYDSSLTAQDIQLRTPPGEATGDLWDADVTLTYLIYDPAS